MVAGAWLMVVPNFLNGAILSAEDFRDNLMIRFGLLSLELRKTCNGCGDKLMVDHELQCNRGGLVTVRHKNMADEWVNLCATALIHSAVAHEPLINYGGQRMVMGGATAEADDEELDRQEDADREERHGNDKYLMEDDQR